MSKPVKEGLSFRAAKNLATTTKSVPQMESITPRWLLRMLPWVQVQAGTYRVNKQKVAQLRPGHIKIKNVEGKTRVEPEALRVVPIFEQVEAPLLAAIAGSLQARQYQAGQTIVREGDPGEEFFLVARGKVLVTVNGHYGETLRVGLLAEGDYFGEIALLDEKPRTATVRTVTDCVLLALARKDFDQLIRVDDKIREQLDDQARHRELHRREHLSSSYRQEMLSAGHEDFRELPETFVDYAAEPREYDLSVIQSVVRIHTRASDIYNDPMDQVRLQLRLMIESIKEEQENELLNNASFGLLNNVDPKMHVRSRTGPPTPDDLDDLLARVWKRPSFFLAHPWAIAAFGRECTRRGVPPPTIQLFGSPFLTWRGVPLVPSDKIPLIEDGNGTFRTKMLLMRVGEAEQGVIGLHQTGIAGEVVPSLAVRFMGIDNRSIASYLLTLYHSAAVLTDDAIGSLEDVEVNYYHDYPRS